MIHISQGHEKGIGIELFFKAALCFPQEALSKFTLHGVKEDIENCLSELNINFEFQANQIKFLDKLLPFKVVKKTSTSSNDSLKSALNVCKESDILLTLPTTKDQLSIDDQNSLGHTEYFRKYFNKNHISMIFVRNHDYILLLSDHIPLLKVPTILTSEFIYNKTFFAIQNLERNKINFDKVIFSGINPHAGEEGLLGEEDFQISKAIGKLRNNFKNLKFKGPVSGDTAHFHLGQRNLVIYAFHDQGLASFKTKHNLNGLNISIGLPFLRLSPDFGTGFDLRGKNNAFYGSMFETLREAVRLHDN